MRPPHSLVWSSAVVASAILCDSHRRGRSRNGAVLLPNGSPCRGGTLAGQASCYFFFPALPSVKMFLTACQRPSLVSATLPSFPGVRAVEFRLANSPSPFFHSSHAGEGGRLPSADPSSDQARLSARVMLEPQARRPSASAIRSYVFPSASSCALSRAKSERSPVLNASAARTTSASP